MSFRSENSLGWFSTEISVSPPKGRQRTCLVVHITRTDARARVVHSSRAKQHLMSYMSHISRGPCAHPTPRHTLAGNAHSMLASICARANCSPASLRPHQRQVLMTTTCSGRYAPAPMLLSRERGRGAHLAAHGRTLQLCRTPDRVRKRVWATCDRLRAATTSCKLFSKIWSG